MSQEKSVSTPKAFLSHNGADKEFVKAVADELGRQFCVFDAYCFEAGKDFVTSIEAGLSQSTLFVLFASPESLKAPWVQYEIDEASYARIGKTLDGFLVIALADSIGHRDLPQWLQRSLIKKIFSPKAAARQIRAHLDEILQRQIPRLFVGRSFESDEFEKILAPFYGNAPRVFVIQGLEGIGRRTFLRRKISDALNLRRLLSVGVKAGDTEYDLAIKIAAEIEPYNTAEGLRKLDHEVRGLSLTDLLSRVSNLIAKIQANDELFVLVDEGGLLDDSGDYSVAVSHLLEKVLAEPTLYAGIITRRKPASPIPELDTLPSLKVDPLRDDDIKRLLVFLLKQHNVVLNAPELEEVAESVKGYPPSAYNAAHLIHRYGAQAILADKSKIVNFRTASFIRYIENDVLLSASQRNILSLLAMYHPLPLAVIGDVLGLDSMTAAASVMRLIDLSLLLLDSRGHYSVSHPVEDAVIRAFGTSHLNHERIRQAIETYLQGAEPEDRTLGLSRALYRAKLLAGSKQTSEWEYRLTGDMLELAWRHYHDRDYESAITLVKTVIQERPEENRALDLYIRSLVQNGQYELAEKECETLRARGLLRQYHFLLGFSRRKQDRPEEAIENYKAAVQRGRNDTAVYRELAQCLVLLKNFDEADEYIRKAIQGDPDNRFIVDLQISISIKKGDLDSARQLLDRLVAIDNTAFSSYRRSVIEAASGNSVEALDWATRAIEATARPTFDMYHQLALCQIKSGQYEDATETLRILDTRFRRHGRDIKPALRCRFELAQGNFENADALWKTISNTQKPWLQKIRQEILAGLLVSRAMPDKLRAQLQHEYNLTSDILRAYKPAELEEITSEMD